LKLTQGDSRGRAQGSLAQEHAPGVGALGLAGDLLHSLPKAFKTRQVGPREAVSNNLYQCTTRLQRMICNAVDRELGLGPDYVLQLE
jgi:hypothetical protein